MNNPILHSRVDEIVELRKQLGIDFKSRGDRPLDALDLYQRGVIDRYIRLLKYKLSLRSQQARLF